MPLKDGINYRRALASDAFAVMNACRAAERAIKYNLVRVITERVCKTAVPPPPM